MPLRQFDRALEVARRFFVAAETAEDAAERRLGARDVGRGGLVAAGALRLVEKTLVGDARFARLAERLVETRRFQRERALAKGVARRRQFAERFAQARRFRPHPLALVDVHRPPP